MPAAPLRVLLASAELSPLCRVGGLAEVTSGLAGALRRDGLDVEVVIPGHHSWPEVEITSVTPLATPDWMPTATARHGRLAGFGELTLIDFDGLERAHPYNDPDSGIGWPDNDLRFFGFAAAVAALARVSEPDVVHLHDWHAASALAWLDAATPTVLTLHNLAYQGDADVAWCRRLGAVSDAFLLDGRVNPLAGAIALADRVVTVSEATAHEARRPAHGFGLDSLLRERGTAFVGIRNGIDVDRWDPSTDPHLPARFDALDLGGKAECRRALLETAGLAPTDDPVIGVVCRFVEQKGVDLALEVAAQLRGLDARMVLMGRGEPHLEQAAEAVAARSNRVAYLRTSDESLAHLVMAGSDLLLVPSRFEPCGLTPMEAMRCGTIPVVSPVGGLRDLVVDASGDLARGNGFIAPAADPVGLSLAVGRAVRALRDDGRRDAIQRNGMTADWSWREPAARYRRLYEEVADVVDAVVADASGWDAEITAATSSRISGRAFEGAPAS